LDSREAELNGVKICLSYPIILRNGSPCISQADLDTAIGPLLHPPRAAPGARIRNIVIDPGHGGKDPGEQNGSHKEKTYTLLLAQELRDQLNHSGFNASLTRTTDTFVELPDRPEIARRRNADLFISLHWNTLPGNRSLRGAQTFCLTPAGASSSNAGGSLIGAGRSAGNRNNEKNILLAWCLQKSLLQIPGMEDRGVRRARYWVLREAVMPAVLIEGGFMSNHAESRRIYDPAYRREMARAIVEGVLNYQRAVGGN
jgi:N-acetylmuramoyl-L-alanine amidase